MLGDSRRGLALVDTSKWVEAAVSKCLAEPVSPDEARDFIIGYTLAQLLWFWRHGLPEPWGAMSEEWEYIAAMRLIYEHAHWATGLQFDEDYRPVREQVREALKKQDWEAYAALPETVWSWLAEISGMAREDWERLPDQISRVLEKTVICPVCGADGPLREVAQTPEFTNPHFIGSRLQVKCAKCDANLSFNVASNRIEPLSARWTVVLLIATLVMLAGLILWPAFQFLLRMF